MNSFLRFSFALFFAGMAGLLAGCAASKPPAAKPVPDHTIVFHDHGLHELQHERALQHFIQAVSFDVKEAYADAILEYQEALDAEPNGAIYYAISKDYWLLNKFERAVDAAHAAVQMDPDNVRFHENLGTMSLGFFPIDSAIVQYQEVVRIDSSYLPGWLALARLYQQTQPQRTLDIYTRLIDRGEDQADIFLQYAQVCASLGRFDEAAEKYKRLLEIDPYNRPVQMQLVQTYTKAGRLDQAQAYLETMVDDDSTDAEAIAMLADVSLDQKQYQKAVSLYEQLLAQGIQNPEIKLRIGVGFFGLAEHDSAFVSKAQSIFEELRNDIPKDWRPYWYLGALAANHHRDSAAAVYFQQVTALEERNADAWWFYGTSLFEQGKNDSVLTTMEQAQKVFPNDFRFYLLQGLALSRQDRQDAAVEPLKKAFAINPKDLNTISTLALTLDALHRNTESDSLYEQGLKLDPKSALMLNNYGYSLSERGLQLDRALEMSRQAITAEPDNAAYLDTYGWILFKLDKFNDAAEYIEKSVATGKASSVVHEHLGDIYHKLGQQTKAIENWKKAVDLDAKNTAAKEKLAHGAN